MAHDFTITGASGWHHHGTLKRQGLQHRLPDSSPSLAAVVWHRRSASSGPSLPATPGGAVVAAHLVLAWPTDAQTDRSLPSSGQCPTET